MQWLAPKELTTPGTWNWSSRSAARIGRAPHRAGLAAQLSIAAREQVPLDDLAVRDLGHPMEVVVTGASSPSDDW